MENFENNRQDENTFGFDGSGNADTNYTQSQNDGFYNKKSDNIIQDDLEHNVPPTYTVAPNSNGFYQNKKIKKPKSVHSTAVVIIASVLAAIIGAASGIVATSTVFKTKTDGSTSKAPQSIGDTTNVSIKVDETASSNAEAVAVKCTDSVVGIRTTTSVASFFGGSQEQTGEGSGVIYTSDGYIVTNYHVISGAVESSNSKVDVFIGNSQSESYPADIIGYNISCDLAVIKIKAEGLTPMEFGNSDELKVGQSVITIGAPGGLEFMGSLTYGIISGLDRTVSTNSSLKLIQTDAAINPGNSGGALLNAEGKLIGINSSKIASVEFEGMGFAIPINTVKEKCDKIISRKSDSQAYLGVSISSTYTSQVLSFYGYPSGAVVSSVAENSPAANAGIERGDIITEFNGVAVSEYTVLNDALYDCEPNDTVSVKIYRNGRSYTISVKLASETSN